MLCRERTMITNVWDHATNPTRYLGHAEIAEFDAQRRREHEVGRLNITMDHSSGLRVRVRV